MSRLHSHGIVIKNLIEMLQKNHIRVAEIGLGRGGMFTEILKSISGLISEYWGIDPFSPLFATSNEKKRYKNGGGDFYFLKACGLMLHYPQLHIVRAASPEVEKIFPDNFFDLIFIDADHSYDAVKADILAWLPHVKLQRFLTGHDYFHRESGVVKAVDEIFGANFLLIKRVWIHQRK